MIWLAILAVAAPIDDARKIEARDPDLQRVIRDARTVWYDDASVPQVYQRDGFVRLARRESSDPNQHNPWRVTGGAHAVAGLRTVKFLHVPRGKKILLWTSQKPRKGGTDSHATVVWAYPVGTVLGEILIDKQRGPFELRTRVRAKDDWVTAFHRPKLGVFVEDHLGWTPPGYADVQSCQQCHEETGLDQSFLKTTRTGWRGKVPGSDGIFSWHPLQWPKTGFKIRPELRKDAEPLVKIRTERDTFRDVVKWLAY